MRIKLHWPDDQTTQYRNTVVADPRPTELVVDEWSYQSVGRQPVALSLFCDGNTETAKYTLFEFPTMIECLGEV